MRWRRRRPAVPRSLIDFQPTSSPILPFTAEDGPHCWWAIDNNDLLAMLRRVAAGESPDMVLAETYANSTHDRIN